MILYKSTRGDASSVGFDEAILNGFAPDGGLFVPDTIPLFTHADLEDMAQLSYVDLAEKITGVFIDPEIMPRQDLKKLIVDSFLHFGSTETAPVVHLEQSDLFVQELFHGPTLSFKDIAMGFLINCMDYFLERKGEKLSLVLATTGDTGPAAAYASAGKRTLECWPLYPKDMISEEQERQMTTLDAPNVHPVGVEGCVNGGDDLDIIVARLFADGERKKELKLSSVNSINWCRVMVQTVHYFFSYFKTVDMVGEKIIFSVPTGAFGNLCAGFVARAMGLPVKQFICATNDNGTLHRLFGKGILSKQELKQTVSSAIDIVVPYNFWRFLYFNCGQSPESVNMYMALLEKDGAIRFPDDLWNKLRQGFTSYSISDPDTLDTISASYHGPDRYLLDPHGAVAVAAAKKYSAENPGNDKIICLATAHPAKFPIVIQQALGPEENLPGAAIHPALERAKKEFHHLRMCEYGNLEQALTSAIKRQLHKQLIT